VEILVKQIINVNEAVIENEELQFIADTKMDLSKMEPSGQILVDSDQLAFVYLADLGGEYAYITIPDDTWTILKEALDLNVEAYVLNEQSRLHLQGLKEEMNYLIENIKGNSNYGEEMVGKVESIF
jgi:hypothetical protein